MEKQIISFDGTKIYYIHKKNKNKNTLIFLHGIATNWTVWRKEIEFFDRLGYSVLAPDLRGLGLSEWPHEEEKYNFLNFTKDIYAIIQKEKISDVTFIGHSLGGAIAINYCEMFNMPASLVLIDTAHYYPYQHNHELNLSPFVNYFLRFLAKHEQLRTNHFPHFTDKTKEIINFSKDYSLLTRLFHHTPLKCIFKCLDTVHEYSEKHKKDTENLLQSLNIPVLIITALKDSIIPFKFSEELHNIIKNSKLKVIKDAHHLVQVEKPEEVNANILYFLKANNIY